ncbi:MAG: hypothetical protein JG780_2040 [Thermosipho sp. (in: Bacteria)]|jgi:hypothetical protein|nr:hypothetical protein [Thermosipho sp. (in: thermotogales)]
MCQKGVCIFKRSFSYVQKKKKLKEDIKNTKVFGKLFDNIYENP